MNTWKAIIVASSFLGLAGSAAAQGASPPLGNWNGSAVAFTLYKNRTYTYRDPGVTLAGTWNWNPTTQVGGVLILNYDTPTVTQTFHNKLYFSITWVNSNTITFSAGPGQTDTLRRQ